MYGKAPKPVEDFSDYKFSEFMHYQYLPVWIPDVPRINPHVRWQLPPNVEFLRDLITIAATDYVTSMPVPENFLHVYLTARHGFATPGNPLNRPGWHCDGFGTNDINYVWWAGEGTRFAIHEFGDISDDHFESLDQFEARINPDKVFTYPEGSLLRLDPFVVHSTPEIKPPGGMRSFVKVSFSEHRYNLEGNSHNYMFDYDWEMFPRDFLRNDPSKAGRDFV